MDLLGKFKPSELAILTFRNANPGEDPDNYEDVLADVACALDESPTMEETMLKHIVIAIVATLTACSSPLIIGGGGEWTCDNGPGYDVYCPPGSDLGPDAACWCEDDGDPRDIHHYGATYRPVH